MKASIKGHNRILKEYRSVRILNKIGLGKSVYFENPFEETAIKYLPGETGKTSKYFIKGHDQNEHEIDFDSNSILKAILEGKPISRARYDKYAPDNS
ncbi:MAG: hypothetical protein WCE64_06855 [Bacteroidales bacterium]